MARDVEQLQRKWPTRVKRGLQQSSILIGLERKNPIMIGLERKNTDRIGKKKNTAGIGKKKH